tara:strand:- start:320 stop:655 length:336 start_codon:yes stop_codon:yes gene_type:complete
VGVGVADQVVHPVDLHQVVLQVDLQVDLVVDLHQVVVVEVQADQLVVPVVLDHVLDLVQAHPVLVQAHPVLVQVLVQLQAHLVLVQLAYVQLAKNLHQLQVQLLHLHCQVQ